MNHSVTQPDTDFVKQAIDLADINALRVALYHQTGDESLANMQVSNELQEGNPFQFTRLAKSHHDEVKAKALDYLMSNASAKPMPDKVEGARLMNLFCGRELSAPEIDYAWGDLAFEGFTRGVNWQQQPPQQVLDNIDITIVGAGFGGLLAAIQLKRLGLNFRIIEKHTGAGGTWWMNDYPEARVDIISFLYQYKFELGYPWKHYYPTQGELLEYVDYILDKHELRDKIIFNTEITDAEWVETEAQWHLTAAHGDGTQSQYQSNFFISASGQFLKPNLPDIPGIKNFQGQIFHSTAWDHDYDYSGKRVAVIGTGSTGVQMVRGLAAKAASVTVYQRSPNWISRMPNYRAPIEPEMQWLLDNMPGYRSWHIFAQHIAQGRMDGMNEVDKDWVAKGGLFNERNDQLRELMKKYIHRAVGGDEALYAKLVPDYAPLARRPVVDNDFYKSLTEDHVELIAAGVESFTETGVIASDGSQRDFDLVVLAAGFEVEAFLWPVSYTGRNGATLGDLWDYDGPRAYVTALLPGFPNFVMMYGPNSGLVAGSFHSWIEIFSNFFCQVIAKTIETGASSFEITRQAYDEFNKELDERSETWVFQVENTGGGYYKNDRGRSAVRLPWRTPEFYEKVSVPNFDHFDIQ
ncbi:MAG: NAD(P)/FAD-dependent oxidoreductase [Pseudomonadota bacterium]